MNRHRVLLALALVLASGLAATAPTLQARAATTNLAGGRPVARVAAGDHVASYSGLTQSQRANLRAIARDTWKFYGADIDQATNLPMDNLTFADGSGAPTGSGRYT